MKNNYMNEINKIFLALCGLMIFALMSMFPELVIAGTSTTFDTLESEGSSMLFGPVGKAIIYFAAAAGTVFAAIKGSLLMAALGIGVGGFLFLTQQVSSSSTFGAIF